MKKKLICYWRGHVYRSLLERHGYHFYFCERCHGRCGVHLHTLSIATSRQGVKRMRGEVEKTDRAWAEAQHSLLRAEYNAIVKRRGKPA